MVSVPTSHVSAITHSFPGPSDLPVQRSSVIANEFPVVNESVAANVPVAPPPTFLTMTWCVFGRVQQKKKDCDEVIDTDGWFSLAPAGTVQSADPATTALASASRPAALRVLQDMRVLSQGQVGKRLPWPEESPGHTPP